MKTSTELSKVVETALPALSGARVCYDERSNMLQTQGYTSAAGNTYYQGIRLSDRIIINYDLGQGYAYLFLNGIRVYGYNGTEKHLIGSRSYFCCGYSEQWAMKETTDIVTDYIKSQMKLMNTMCTDEQVKQFSYQLVRAAYSQMKEIA